MLLMVGFSIAFTVALGPGLGEPIDDFRKPWTSLVWLVDAGLWGFGGLNSKEHTSGYVSFTEIVIIVMFNFLMVMVALIMLNLLIAIMNSAYESVQKVAQLEVLHERSVIILGIERLLLPLVKKCGWRTHQRDAHGSAHADVPFVGGDDDDPDFPRWLHLLVPTGLLHPHEFV